MMERTFSLLSALLLSALFLAPLQARAAGGEPDALSESELTTLRVIGTPRGTFENYKGSQRLLSVQFQVRNVGDVPAKDISAAIILPGGVRKTIPGPTTLGPNQTGKFFSDSLSERVLGDQKLKAEVSCQNCRR